MSTDTKTSFIIQLNFFIQLKCTVSRISNSKSRAALIYSGLKGFM